MTRRGRSILPFLAIFELLGCNSSCGEPSNGGAPGSSSAASAASPATSSTCAAHRPMPGTETFYTCPDTATATRCSADDVTGCVPQTRTRGKVPPGGKCVRPTSADAWRYELGDDCAPHRGTTSSDAPKGSYCVTESGPGSYCTHGCKSDADCSDLHRDGFTVACSGGACLMSNGTGAATDH